VGFIAVEHFSIVGGGVVVRSFFLLWDSEGFGSSFGRLSVCVGLLLFRGRRRRGREKGRSKRRRKRQREKNHHTQGGKREGRRRQQRGQR
jgi:hypothetical protein